MRFDFDFPIESWVLWGVVFLCALYIVVVYCHRLFRIGRYKAKCQQNEPIGENANWPDVSIVIYARNESEALERNLPLILEQDYPGKFEVVVVNEGASEETSMTVGKLRLTHANLYLTYTPDGARNLSRKKLALTLGIKAAKGDIVLVTSADTRVSSNQWLTQMVQPLIDDKADISLGCGMIATPEVHLMGRLTRAFDLAADEVAWINGAISGKPYRCCGFNMAYKRHLFFDNKGFSRSLNLREGVDDIFLSEIARGRVAKVQFTDESLAFKEMLPYMRETRDFRSSHYFTGRKLRHFSQRLMAAGEWGVWLTLLLSILALWLTGWNNWAAIGISAILVVTPLVLLTVAWHKALTALKTPHSILWLPLQATTRPLRNIAALGRSRLFTSHYTWIK